MRVRSVAAVGIAAAFGLAGMQPASAGIAPPEGVRVVAKDLDGPYGIHITGRQGFLVAENVSGQISAVTHWGRERLLLKIDNVAGVSAGYGHVFGLTGASGGGPEDAGPPPPRPNYPQASVIRMDYEGHHVKVIADLMKYELAHNPDGQLQFDPKTKQPFDALSNPFSIDVSAFGLLIADGGGNVVYQVDPTTGRIRPFFVPPTVKDVAACLAPGAQANPGTIGCDPVPTGVDVVGDFVYVCTLGAEVPGASKIYKLDRHGTVVRVWTGFTSLTGIAVSPNGTIYATQALEGAPPESNQPPPPIFDPWVIGRVLRIAQGRTTYARVTMPTGIDYRNGELYVSAWGTASFYGLQHAGQIVKVADSAFH